MATPEVVDELLTRTLDDHRLSRSERQALEQTLQELERVEDRAAVCRRAFELARGVEGREVLDWLEGVVKVLMRPSGQAPQGLDLAEAHFSPGDDCPRTIVQLLGLARSTLDVCVFTITDDRLSTALIDAKRRGVAVRVITDNDKVSDEGSDIIRLDEAGIPVRVDRTEYHMHHKFALIDGRILLTGSYNWTRGAARYNNENFISTSDRRLITPFTQVFEGLWRSLA
jgi:phosphatidylserine/phosphatidylglycerophosphate/cardiolipin synthase-like enzyme